MTWVLELSRAANLPMMTLLYRLHFIKDDSMSARDVLYASDPESESSYKIILKKIEWWKKVRELKIKKCRLQEGREPLWCVDGALTNGAENVCSPTGKVD